MTVAVIGAGPTGMTAAALLARRGAKVHLFEREAEVVAIPRAVHCDEEVVRIAHLAGFGGAFASVTTPFRGMRLVDRHRTPLVSFEREGRGPHGFLRSNAFDQPELERAMRAALAREPNVVLRTATTVEAVEPLTGHRQRVTVRDVATGGTESMEMLAVLGCDGARSRARTFVGTDFEDLGFDARWLVVDVVTPHPLGLYEGCLQVADPEHPTTYVRTGPDRHRWEIMLSDGESAEDATLEANVRKRLAPWLGAQAADVTLRRTAVYTFHSLVARTYRRGRLFLLGDAAHQMPPFIGQGLGAGIRDAANLAWKLAAVLDGKEEEAILDTYEAERRPHVRAVTKQAVMLGRTMQSRAFGEHRDAWLRRLGRSPVVRGLALRRAFPELGLGPLVKPRGSGPAGGHAPRAAVVAEGRETHLDDVLGQDFALLIRQEDGRVRVGDLDGRTLALVRGHELDAWLDAIEAEAVLVRPDRVVMASGRRSAVGRWREALTRAGWVGTPHRLRS